MNNRYIDPLILCLQLNNHTIIFLLLIGYCIIKLSWWPRRSQKNCNVINWMVWLCNCRHSLNMFKFFKKYNFIFEIYRSIWINTILTKLIITAIFNRLIILLYAQVFLHITTELYNHKIYGVNLQLVLIHWMN